MMEEIEELFRGFRENMPGWVTEHVPLYLHSNDYDNRSMTAVIHPSPWMADRTGAMSVGAFAVALDQVMGILCLYLVDGMTPTVTMQYSLLRPIPLEGDLYIDARVVNTDGTKIDVVATARSAAIADGPVATATGIYYRGGMRQPIPKRF